MTNAISKLSEITVNNRKKTVPCVKKNDKQKNPAQLIGAKMQYFNLLEYAK